MNSALEVLRVEPATTAAGPPLLLVHGGYFAAWCWENFQPYLADRGYASHALSLRGHGGSPGIERIDKFRMRDYVADIVSVLDELSLGSGDKPVLVGHSMGGGLVQAVLKDHAHKVSGAVLLSSLPPSGFSKMAAFSWLSAGMGTLMQLSRLHRGKLPAGAADSRETFPYSCFFHGDLPLERLVSYGRRMQAESQRAGKELTRTVVKDPAAIRVPIQVISGAEDWFFPVGINAQTAAAYGVTPIVVPGAGHAAMLDTGWEATAEQILAFLPQCATR